MSATAIALVALTGVAIAIWALTLWGVWAEKVYERERYSSAPWYWLRVMGITTSRENCVRFLKIVSALGLVLVLLGVVAGLFLGAIE